MRVQRANYEIRTSKLSSEFGEAMAARWFTADELALWPRLKAGKNKGKLAGSIEWKKVKVGGWQRDKNGVGGVQRPGTRDVTLVCSVREMGMTRERRMQTRGAVAAQQAEHERRAALLSEIDTPPSSIFFGHRTNT